MVGAAGRGGELCTGVGVGSCWLVDGRGDTARGGGDGGDTATISVHQIDMFTEKLWRMN